MTGRKHGGQAWTPRGKGSYLGSWAAASQLCTLICTGQADGQRAVLAARKLLPSSWEGMKLSQLMGSYFPAPCPDLHGVGAGSCPGSPASACKPCILLCNGAGHGEISLLLVSCLATRGNTGCLPVLCPNLNGLCLLMSRAGKQLPVSWDSSQPAAPCNLGHGSGRQLPRNSFAPYCLG